MTPRTFRSHVTFMTVRLLALPPGIVTPLISYADPRQGSSLGPALPQEQVPVLATPHIPSDTLPANQGAGGAQM
jgi:hypothetical protein